MKSLRYTLESPEVIEVCNRDEKLGRLIRSLGDLVIVLPNNYFNVLCRNIVGQQLSVRAAATIWGRFEDFCGGEVLPVKVREAKDEDLRTLGLSRPKITYLKDLCNKVLEQELQLEKIVEMTDDEIIENLTRVKGIGKWTAEMFLIFSLGRPDVFAVDDLGLQRAVKWVYDLEEMPSKKDMAIYKEGYKPFGTVASLYLWEGINRKIIP